MRNPKRTLISAFRGMLKPRASKNKDLLKLCIKYNTALPSNAAIKRVFLIGKDMLKAEKAGLSDSPFEMLLFSKVNS